MKCAVIARYRGEFPLALMCRVLRVARSTFYAWRQRAPSPRLAQDTRLRLELTAFQRRSGRTCGRPRLLRDLRDAGYRVGHERVRRLMPAAGRVGTPRRKFRVTTVSDARHAAAANVLDRHFAVGAINRAWVADITYCWTAEGWLYLAVLLDVGPRRVVGWASSPRLDRALVLTALRRAVALRQPGAALVHHSDRGTQYTSLEYGAFLAARGIRGSMSRPGDCWDNAVAESFFATLKRELLQRTRWTTRAAATQALTDYIDGGYNRFRRHSSLDYLSPMTFEQKLASVA